MLNDIEEQNWDKNLNIKTTGRDDSNSTLEYFPYEATPYEVLKRIANSGYIRKQNTLLDYGSGKGRVDFFLSFQTKCRSIGVEYDKRLYIKSINNLNTAVSKNKVNFINTLAEDYNITNDIDRFYFFNPFCINVFKKVLNNIVESYNNYPRQMYLFFYFPSDEYIAYLMSHKQIMFVDEIDCTDIFNEETLRERVLIFEVS